MPDLAATPNRPQDRDALLAEDANEPSSVARGPSAERKTVVVILNRQGGGVARLGDAEARGQIVSAFANHGIAAEVILSHGGIIAHIARDHIRAGGSRPAAIIAAGGDGTVSAIAQELAGSTMPLGILPLGTLNHFARDLGLPLDIAGAVAVIAAGTTAAVDAAEVNGRIFVNNSAIGLYPNIVRDRDRQLRLSRRAKWLAMAVALLRALRRPPIRRLTIEAED